MNMSMDGMDMPASHNGFTPPIPPDGINSVLWANLDNWYLQSKYALAITLFCVGFVALGIVSQAWRVVRSRWRSVGEKKVYRMMTASGRWLVLKRVFPRSWAAPRLGTLIPLGVFFLWTTIWTFAVRPYYRFQRNWGSPPLATRAGWMAFAVIPWTLIFASRVSPLPLLTGVSAEKLQVYHQYGARVLLFMSVVHTIPFIYQPLKDWGREGLAYQWYSADDYPFNWTGMVGLAALFWIVFSSFAKLRASNYTFFVIQHIVSAMLFITMMFMHIMTFMDTDTTKIHSQAYLIASAVIFIFSFAARAFLHVRSESFGKHKAEVTILEGGVVRLEMQTRMTWAPGQWVLVRVPSLKLLTSHPFTVASIPNCAQPTWPLVLLSRVQSPRGLVAQMYKRDYADSSEIDVVVDGPYGGDWIDESVGWKGYDSVVLIAGGSGVSWTTSHFLALLRLAAWNAPDFHVREIDFVWVVRDQAHLDWIRPALDDALANAHLPSHLVVRLRFFVSSAEADLEATRTNSQEKKAASSSNEHTDDEEDESGDKPVNSKANTSTSIEVKRPDLPALLDEILATRTAQMGAQKDRAVAVGVCGTASLTTELSDHLAHLQLSLIRGRLAGVSEIMSRVERFGW